LTLQCTAANLVGCRKTVGLFCSKRSLTSDVQWNRRECGTL